MIYKVPHTSIINLVLGTPQKRKKKTTAEPKSAMVYYAGEIDINF
jgi:hypothetical protein